MNPYQDNTLTPEERARDLLGRMTLEEKLAQINILRGVDLAQEASKITTCTVEEDDVISRDRLEARLGNKGIGYIHDIYSIPKVKNEVQRYLVEETRLGIPCIFTGEALHGLSFRGASIFPVPLTLAATFDPELVRRIGDGIASETRALGHHEILAPNLDVAREPRWGRCEETFGEDTFLCSAMARAIISGEQKGDIGRTDAVICEPKHYCAHGIAEGGTNCAPARAGRREIETCYLPVFEAGIRDGGAYNVMACYNSIDSEPVMTSHYYLTEVLKERLGLRGISRADWGGVSLLMTRHHLTRDRREAVRMAKAAGLDMQGCCDYPEGEWDEIVGSLIEDGSLSIESIDESVLRVLKMKFELGLFEHPYADEEAYRQVVRCQKHQDVSLEAAREAIVLLKNDGLLPLSREMGSVALLGPSSAAQKVGGYSSEVKGYRIRSVYEELKDLLPNTAIRQCDGCGITEGQGDTVRFVDGQPHLTQTLDGAMEDRIDQAVELARQCDIAVIVGGDNNVTSGEGVDRSSLRLYGKQRELIRRVAETGTPVVLVLENGKAVELSAESEQCGAILSAGFGGEFGAKAIAEALVGAINPGGRLPVSYPASDGSLPCYYSMLPGGSEQYLEGPKKALYPFGHGLSYTSFEYSGLAVEQTGPCDFRVSLCVTNTGDRLGDEVVQLYVNDIDSSIVTPMKLLQGFQRVTLQPGEQTRVEFSLGFSSFRLLNVQFDWVVEPGEFELMLGSSSEDIRLRTVVCVEQPTA